MTDPTMNDAEEEALFARLRRGLELVRRDACVAQGDGPVAPAGPDPETTAALARVEASLRTLASNVEALARRADGVDAALETRVETTVARTTAGLRAEIERLSSALASFSPRPDPVRPDPVRPDPARLAARPVPDRAGPATPPPRRGIGRALLTVFVALVLIVLGATAATRLGYGPDRLPISQNLQQRFSAWRAAWLPGWMVPSSGQAQPSAPSASADPAPKPSKMADAAAPPTTPPRAAAAPTTPAAPAPLPPAAFVAAATPPPPAPPPPPPPPAPPVAAAVPAPTAQAAPAPSAPAATPAPDTTPTDTDQAAAPTSPPPPSHASGIVLRAKAPVWVEVRERRGRILLRRTLQAGETWSAPADSDPDLLLSAGNAHSLELTVNGAPQPLPATKGSVLRDARIDGT